jgi:hypothetical protein
MKTSHRVIKVLSKPDDYGRSRFSMEWRTDENEVRGQMFFTNLEVYIKTHVTKIDGSKITYEVRNCHEP